MQRNKWAKNVFFNVKVIYLFIFYKRCTTNSTTDPTQLLFMNYLPPQFVQPQC